LEAALWTIPAQRMKAGKEHRVPLSGEALALLRAVPRQEDVIFSGRKRGAQLSEISLTTLPYMVTVLRSATGAPRWQPIPYRARYASMRWHTACQTGSPPMARRSFRLMWLADADTDLFLRQRHTYCRARDVCTGHHYAG